MTETTMTIGGLWLHPSVLLIAGALLLPLFKGVAQQTYRVALAALFLFVVFRIEQGNHAQILFGGLELVAGRADKLSLAFAYVFSIITLIATIYSLHVRDNIQHVAGLFYAAAAVGVVFAGDLITLYVFWELMMLASVWLIWRRATAQAYAAGYRYLMVHAVSGVVLLGGIVLYYSQTGSLTFEQIQVGSWASYLILIGFLVNAAVPPLHAWLTDAYPEATVTGAIFLSALTTKTAVYTLIRGYPGTEFLVWLGTVMALWGVVYAVLANDIRRLLGYHIISQVGYMVAGVGMGTAIALNGATAHAFTHILYKSVLFMGAGAVIAMTGKSKLTELGGIYKYMPITFLLYMIGAFSISAFPLFSGFVSKTMVVEAAAVDHRAWIWLLLSMASAGTFLHTGLKLPYFTFLGQDAGLRPREAPWNMLLAMGIAAFFCVFIGVNPAWLYQFMPTPVEYNAYSAGHLFWELQLLLFTGLGFFLMLKHLGGEARLSVDTDWVYRKAGPVVIKAVGAVVRAAWRGFLAALQISLISAWNGLKRLAGADGILGRTWGIGRTTLWTVVLVSLYGLVYLII
ncbi:MAG: Na(+)/H(+) antiporter subunit D [Rubrivivax sp.]|nr:Na(+)/H(+) antiporter subunit D [Rubrivivax sp.]